jgi:hypothetical protein
MKILEIRKSTEYRWTCPKCTISNIHTFHEGGKRDISDGLLCGYCKTTFFPGENGEFADEVQKVHDTEKKPEKDASFSAKVRQVLHRRSPVKN